MKDLLVFKFKIFMMMNNDVLNSLAKRNGSLKSRLIHDQLRYGNYSFEHSQRQVLTALNQYRKHRSFFKVACEVGLTQKQLMDWYVQGQMGNPNFRGFYLRINEINKSEINKAEIRTEDEAVCESEIDSTQDGEYEISQYGDGWSYKTFIDGEKVFLISDDLESLKRKVRDNHLPLD